MREYICPFCGKKMNRNATHHIYTCKENKEIINKDDIKYEYIIFNYGKEIINMMINDYINLSSLPMLKEKYCIDFKSILFVLKYNKVKIRNSSESNLLITKEKSKKTCIKKFGVDNASKSDIIKQKKKNTFLKHYGVDNIWKTKDYVRNIWKNYTEERKQEIIRNVYASINKNKESGSKIEKRIASIFDDMNLSYCRQFFINGSRHPYDFRISNSNILIEVNGKWWHADPRYYKEDDIVKQPGKKYNLKAKDIWDKDKKNIDFALKNDFIVVTLWEDDIINKNDCELMKFIIDTLNNI